MVNLDKVEQFLRRPLKLCSEAKKVQRQAERHIQEIDSILGKAAKDSNAKSKQQAWLERLSTPTFRYGLHLDCALPFILADAFPKIETIKLEKLGVASILYREHVVSVDIAVDGALGLDGMTWAVLRSSVLDERALELLSEIGATSSVLWGHLYQCNKECIKAILEEIKHHGRLVPYTLDELPVLAPAQGALRKLILTVLAALTNDEKPVPNLSKSLDHFALANHLVDDLEDWREDYERSHYTYLLTRVIYEYGLHTDVTSGTRPSPDQIGRYVFFSGTARDVLKEAIRQYEMASEMARKAKCSAWAETLGMIRQRRERLLDDLASMEKKLLQAKY